MVRKYKGNNIFLREIMVFHVRIIEFAHVNFYVSCRKYSVVNYSGTEIVDVPVKEENVIEFESDIDLNDTD